MIKNKIIALCTMIIVLCITGKLTFAQSSSPANNFAPGYFLGWGVNSGDLQFRTNYIQRMILLDNSGLFGIGLNFTPNNRLDVDSGDIDVNQPLNCYMIGDSAVLHYRGDATYTVPKISNIFVGVGAGQHNTTGDSNVMVGFHAGYSNAIESQETFVGFQAGQNTHSGRGNTFVGSLAGHDNDFGQGNVFMGVRAGYATFGFLGSLTVVRSL